MVDKFLLVFVSALFLAVIAIGYGPVILATQHEQLFRNVASLVENQIQITADLKTFNEKANISDIQRQNQSAIAFIPWLVDIEEDQDATNIMLRALEKRLNVTTEGDQDLHSISINGTHVTVDNVTKEALPLPFGVKNLFNSSDPNSTTGNTTANQIISGGSS